MSFMMTISRSMPRRTLSALAPASDTDMREEMMSPLGTILIAAYLPVIECLAIFTRPLHRQPRSITRMGLLRGC
jgi:hypothetical protein